ncbi:hypothetical protein BASA81_005380 [Batrachochytrium salamandrivorans]|nr:hypothetical protein BASA81_005380 [Batrachochytrium salamandrivorans]
MLSVETLSGLDKPEAEEFLLTTYLERLPPGRYRAKKLVSLIQNLSTISKNSPSLLLSKLAKRAGEEVGSTHDAMVFRQLQASLKQNPNEGESQIWLERVERENRVRRAQLESSLIKAKSEGGKEGPRLALKDLGMFFVETGDGANATRVLFQGKDYCTSNASHLEMALLVMESSLEFQNYTYASTFAQKAEQLCAKGDGDKIRLVLGLCELERKRYKNCGKLLLQLVNGTLPMITLEDICTVAVMCAMATFTRTEIQLQVLDNQQFKPILERVPVLKDLVLDFTGSNYAKLTKTLEQAAWVLRIDPLLAPHAEFLCRQVFVQAVQQFVSPYANVKLEKMANKFDLSQNKMEHELATLVGQGQIGHFRIDAQNQLLVRRSEDDAQMALKSAIMASEASCRETRSMLFRASLLEQQVVYNPIGFVSHSGGGGGERSTTRQKTSVESSMFGDVAYSSDED